MPMMPYLYANSHKKWYQAVHHICTWLAGSDMAGSLPGLINRSCSWVLGLAFMIATFRI